MKLIAPDYYPAFSCIADKCRHSCCIGWEIDVDSDTYEYYKQINSDFGKRLMCGIDADGETPHFILSHDERCPFLNSRNLCDIITNLGEEALCQICSDHPRYRSFFSDRTEIGLGLCCEAAGKIILTHQAKMYLIQLEDDGEDEFIFDDEQAFFNLRNRIFDILQNRNLPVKMRIENMLAIFNVSFPKKSYKEWAAIFKGLERLDGEWDNRLDMLKAIDTDDLDVYETAFEQLLIYFIYRHLSGGLDDGMICERALFAVLGYHIIHALCCVWQKNNGSLEIDDIVEAARLYSSEIEYSEDNINSLLEILKG